MKVFISWSGNVSKEIARELYEWLPMLVQSIDPYMSSESIDKGTRWAASVASELEGAKVGILVMVPDNLQSPWLHFEAGALAKVVDESRLAPLLFGLKPSDVHAPLSQFQVSLFDKEDVWKLVKSVNSAAGDECLPESRLQKMFEALWPSLESKISPIIASAIETPPPSSQKNERNTAEILEEVLVLTRQQTQILSTPEKLFPTDILLQLLDATEELRKSPRRQIIDREKIEYTHFHWGKLEKELRSYFSRTMGAAEESAINSKIKVMSVLMGDLLFSVTPRGTPRRYPPNRLPEGGIFPESINVISRIRKLNNEAAEPSGELPDGKTSD